MLKVRVSPDTKRAVKQLALDTGTTVQDIMFKLLTDFLAENVKSGDWR
jgi:hypothetical protein